LEELRKKGKKRHGFFNAYTASYRSVDPSSIDVEDTNEYTEEECIRRLLRKAKNGWNEVELRDERISSSMHIISGTQLHTTRQPDDEMKNVLCKS